MNAGPMTLAQALALIAAQSAQIERQAETHKAQALRISRLAREVNWWRSAARATEKLARQPTHKERLLAEAEAIFRGQDV